jgi:hypothetical protein
MSETSPPRRVLHLIVEGFPAARWKEIEGTSAGSDDVTEFFELTETNARDALEKIFAADTVAVWGELPA